MEQPERMKPTPTRPTKQSKPKPKRVRRKLEAAVGLPLVDLVLKVGLKLSKLEGPNRVFLPGCGIPVNYYERKAVRRDDRSGMRDDPNDNDLPPPPPAPTLLLLHGLSGNVNEVTAFVHKLGVPETVRILVPEHIGHGQDLKRAASEGKRYEQPTPDALVKSTIEFLDRVGATTDLHALGCSLGGAILYYLNVAKPGLVRRSVLCAPALPCLIADPFLRGIRDGSNELFEFRDRDDVKRCFRSYFWLDPRNRSKKTKKKDPIPKLFYEVTLRLHKRNVPAGHYKALQQSLLLGANYQPSAYNGDRETKGNEPEIGAGAATEHNNDDDDDDDDDNNDDSIYAATVDRDPNGHRLVLWAEEDQICDVEKGRRFFQSGSSRTTFEAIPNCGHAFDANGVGFYEVIAPKVKDFLLDFSSSRS